MKLILTILIMLTLTISTGCNTLHKAGDIIKNTSINFLELGKCITEFAGCVAGSITAIPQDILSDTEETIRSIGLNKETDKKEKP